MKTIANILFFILFFSACAKPRATVFLDQSLAEEEKVKLCFTGDMGKDTSHQQAIAKALGREDCHRIFFLGDLVYPKGIDSLEDEEFTEKFLNYYEPLLQQNPDLYINLILGNHDHKGNPAAWKKIRAIDDRFFFPGYYYMLDYGGLCIVALDTSFYYYLNDVSEIYEQTAWIQGLQARLKKCDIKIAITHHPFKGTGLDPDDDWEGPPAQLKSFLDTYVIGVFDIHLAGHVHVVADNGKDEGTRMLISGAGGEIRGKNRPEKKLPGYIILNWSPGNPKRIGYAIKEIDVETAVFDESDSIQRQEEVLEPEYIIPRKWVEMNTIHNMWEQIKSYF